jgi:preprotein translocase subunit SecE
MYKWIYFKQHGNRNENSRYKYNRMWCEKQGRKRQVTGRRIRETWQSFEARTRCVNVNQQAHRATSYYRRARSDNNAIYREIRNFIKGAIVETRNILSTQKHRATSNYGRARSNNAIYRRISNFIQRVIVETKNTLSTQKHRETSNYGRARSDNNAIYREIRNFIQGVIVETKNINAGT